MMKSIYLLPLLLLGCGDRDPVWNKPLQLDGPHVAGQKLIWLNKTADLLVSLDPSQTTPDYLALEPRSRAIAPAGDLLLVIGGDGAAPVLQMVRDTTIEHTLSLPGAYDRIIVSPNNTHALLLYDPAVPPAAGSPAARNSNELAVVDITQRTVERVLLETESVTPREVVFSPDGSLGAIVLDAAVALVDLADPSVHLRVPLVLPGGDRLAPQEGLFAPDGAFFYVRTAETNDVLALEITRGSTGLMGSINFLFVPGAGRLLDIDVPNGSGFDRYVAALFQRADDAQRGLAVLMDATGDSSRTRITELRQVATRFQGLEDGVLLLHDSPPVGASNYIAGWEPLADRLDEEQLSGRTMGPPISGRDMAFFQHDVSATLSSAAVVAITAVSVQRQLPRLSVELNPVVVGGALIGTATKRDKREVYLGVDILREDSGAAPNYVDVTDFSGQTGALVVIDDGLAISGLPLDDPITEVGAVGAHLYALHPGTFGDITFVPRDSLTRDAASRHDGFLLSGLLDRPEED